MLNTKKILAAALAATMVFGSSLTAFAEDPVTSGGSDGAGASEGHVEKEVLNVVLPVIPTGSTPFAYTMDPERLIQATEAAKYTQGTHFPEVEGDTGVYFLTGENTYANESKVVQAINKSSCNITLTVKVKTTATSGDTNTDIALAESSTVATTGTPDLYLGLKVGNTTTVVSGTEQTVTKKVEGAPGNFEVAVATGANDAKSYVYQQKADATTWKAVNISMEGAVSNLPIAKTTTAPTVNVTWSYAKNTDNEAVATDVVDYSDTPASVGPSVDLGTTSNGVATITKAQLAAAENVATFNFGSGDDAVEAITSVTYSSNGTDFATFSVPNDWYTVSGNKLTVTSRTVDWITADRYFKVTFDNDNAKSITLKFVVE